MAAADGPITAIYEVKYLFAHVDPDIAKRICKATVRLTENYTDFEDIRKIIVTGRTGDPKAVDKIDVLSARKIWGKPDPAPENGA